MLELTLPLRDVVVDEHGATFACAFVPAGHIVRATEALDAAVPTIPSKELLTRAICARTLVCNTRRPLSSMVVFAAAATTAPSLASCESRRDALDL